MTRCSQLRLLAFLAITTLLAIQAPLQMASSATVDSSQLYTQIGSAFARVRTIEGEGGNVTGVVGQLNQALSLVAAGQANESGAPDQALALYQQAGSIIEIVNQELPGVESTGIASSQSEIFWLALTLIALTAMGVAIYFFGGRVFWSLWISAHKGWRVKRQ